MRKSGTKSGAKRKVGREKWGKEKSEARKVGHKVRRKKWGKEKSEVRKWGEKNGTRKVRREKIEARKVGQRKSGAQSGAREKWGYEMSGAKRKVGQET